MRHYTFNSLFTRLFLSFMLVLVPIYAIGAAIMLWGQQTIQAEIENSTQAQIAFLTNKMEAEISRIKAIQSNFLNDSTVRKLANEYHVMPDYDRYTMIADLNRRLLITEYGSDLLSEVILHLPRLNKSISTVQGYVDLSADERDRLVHDAFSTFKPVLVDRERVYMVTAIPIADVQRLPLVIIESRLSVAALEKYLTQFETYAGSSVWLYHHETDALIMNPAFVISDSDRSAVLSQFSTREPLVATIELAARSYLLISRYSTYLDATISHLIPAQIIYLTPNTGRRLFWFFSLVALAIAVFYALSTYRFVHAPLRQIVQSFHSLEDGNLSVRITSPATHEFHYLYTAFNRMVSVLNQQIEKGYKLEIYNRQAELKQLQSQINPHFMYNTYFMLHRMIKEGDQSNALALSAYLGRYMQSITRDAHDEVTLQQELEHAITYMQIQSLRFAGRIHVTYPDVSQLGDTSDRFFVPRLILQPLLENAFEHGLAATEIDGLVQLTCHITAAGLDIAIEDNNPRLTEQDIAQIKSIIEPNGSDHETTGLLNVHKRIQIKFGTGSGLTIGRGESGGLAIRVHIEQAKE
jgi:two-component system sensor histidine kinase YesM